MWQGHSGALMLVCCVRRFFTALRGLWVATRLFRARDFLGEVVPRLRWAGNAGVMNAGEGCTVQMTSRSWVFINATTHQDPLCPTSIGCNPHQHV